MALLSHLLYMYIVATGNLTFERRIAILQEIIELAWVSFNEIPYAGMEDGRNGDKQLFVLPQILEARHYHWSAMEKINK